MRLSTHKIEFFFFKKKSKNEIKFELIQNKLNGMIYILLNITTYLYTTKYLVRYILST